FYSNSLTPTSLYNSFIPTLSLQLLYSNFFILFFLFSTLYSTLSQFNLSLYRIYYYSSLQLHNYILLTQLITTTHYYTIHSHNYLYTTTHTHIHTQTLWIISNTHTLNTHTLTHSRIHPPRGEGASSEKRENMGFRTTALPKSGKKNTP